MEKGKGSNRILKYCVLIIDGAAGLPLPERRGKTCLELAHTPNLDAMAPAGLLGMARTIPLGTEPSSDHACMSLLGYDPVRYHLGRAAIEAASMGITIGEGEVVFRCNLVAIRDGKMWDYSAGHISTAEAEQLIQALNASLGNDRVHFYPGVSYRHLCKLRGQEATLLAICIPPNDIPDQPVAQFLPRGQGSDLLLDLMQRSQAVLREHPVNVARLSRGDTPASMIWLCWGSGQAPALPSFQKVYGLEAAVTSAVDVIRGLAHMMGMGVLEIAGVKDGLDNDFVGQAAGALSALNNYDLVVIHVEATDEAGHIGSIEDKVEAIQRVDSGIVSQLRAWRGDKLRVLVMPDHPTPIATRTHSPEPVPFLLWGAGFTANGGKRFTEAEASKTGLLIDPGYNIMSRLVGKDIVMSVIDKIREALGKGKLAEPFGKKDLEKAVPDLGRGTYSAYLWKHCIGNRGGYKEYFEKVAPGEFRLKGR